MGCLIFFGGLDKKENVRHKYAACYISVLICLFLVKPDKRQENS